MEKIFVTKSTLPNYEDYCGKIKSIWDTRLLTNNGPLHNQLESELIEHLNVYNMTLFTNGHLALYTALKVLNLKGEVITTPFTFASSINAIVENGLDPVFCDIDPITYTIDTSKIESLITNKTCAILPIHVYGNVCNVEKIEEIAKKHKLKVIYDGAHVFGVKYKGTSVFNFGDISMTSFHATKVFNTIEGGALFYRNCELYSRLKALKNFGIDDEGMILEESINAKMNEFQAAMGLCNLVTINMNIEKRKKVYQKYIDCLEGIDGIKLNYIQADVKPNYAYFPVVFDKKIFRKSSNEIFDLLSRNNIFARKYFYPLITDYSFYKNRYNSADTPVAREISDNILCLPIYPDLDLKDVVRICELIKGE